MKQNVIAGSAGVIMFEGVAGSTCIRDSVVTSEDNVLSTLKMISWVSEDILNPSAGNAPYILAALSSLSLVSQDCTQLRSVEASS